MIMERPRGYLAPQCDICGFGFIKSAGKVRWSWDECSLAGLKLSSCHTSERAHFLQSKMFFWVILSTDRGHGGSF